MKFEEGKEEVIFYSVTIDRNSGQLGHTDVVCTSKLIIERSAKAQIDLGTQIIDVIFWWEPSATQYPQLYGKINHGENNSIASRGLGLDFVRTIPD